MAMATRLIEIGSIDIEAIKDQHPLASIVEPYVSLKRRSGKLEGLCPFHEERTPSFKIYEQDQRYHCFGCGAHGDAFDFLEHMEGLDLRGAAERITGGTFPTYSPERIEELRAKRAAFEAQEAAERAKAIESARKRWDAAVDADIHPYLVAKGIQPHGARIEPDGALLTPLVGRDGRIQCVQAIHPDGRKQFPKGGTITGGFFVMGGKVATTEQPVILCEGFATGATIQEATGNVVICTYNGANMVAVAAFFAERYPHKEFLVAGDNDHGKKDNPGLKRANEAAALLKCAAIVPAWPEGAEGTDFNDMAAAYGQEAVRALIVEGVAPDGTVVVEGHLKTVDAFDFDEAAIPPRPWIVPGVLLARHTHMLVAPGGSGKSLFTLQLAIMLSTAAYWGEWKPRKRCRTLIINVEDDIDEQRRRLSAARQVMAPDPALLRGMIHLAEEPDSIVVARIDPTRKAVIATPVVAELRRYIEINKIDVLIVDPFAETFEGDENSNSEVKWAMKIWRDEIARQTGCAVYLVHHTTKYSAGKAGDADAIRGAGAIVNSTRISSTLFTMTEDEAKAMGIASDDRHMYVRFDDAKANQTLKTKAKWFEKLSVTIGNGNGFNEADVVGALKPWTPPGAFAGCAKEDIHTALLLIERGLEDAEGRPIGVRFTHRTNTEKGTKSERWAGRSVMDALGVNEERAKLILKEWMSNGMLVEVEYFDPQIRKERNGLTVSAEHLEGLAR